MKEITLLDLFSGVGGFAKGLQQAGFTIKKHYFSEIDKHAIANYKYNFKNAEYLGSVTDVSGAGIDHPDIITFGSPCQDFSLAGKREGMGGQRSVLILEAIRIITECKPSAFIWENVKGAFSSNAGADFWAIIDAFANIGVGHLTGRSEPGVFPIGEPNKIYNRTRKVKKEIHTNNRVAITQAARQYSNWCGDFIKVNSNTSNGFETATIGDSINLSNPNSKTRRGRVGKGKSQTLDTKCNQAVIQLNPSTESGGKQPYQQNRVYDSEGISPTIDQAAGRWSIADYRTDEGIRVRYDGNSPTLQARARNDASGAPILINSTNIRRLTEIECERLQGFPDNWTEYGNYNGEIKKISKTQRYKMMGNAVTVDVVHAVAEKLKLNY